MEMVVKIPDDMIKSLEQGSFGAKYNIYDLVGCLMNGKLLPADHGRLIDADDIMNDIKNDINEMTNIGIGVDGQYLWGKLNDAIYNAPTIIEGSEEDADSD